ncbi:MAG: hypothetical protein HQL56_02135 [Magnetococcales bacterium]|nr:hypothetical protein [Magnetococcales bacterium]
MKRITIASLLVFLLAPVMGVQGDEAGYRTWEKGLKSRSDLSTRAAKGEAYPQIERGYCYITGKGGCIRQLASGTDLWMKALRQGEHWIINDLILSLAEESPSGKKDPGIPWMRDWKPLCEAAGYAKEHQLESLMGGTQKSYAALCFLAGKFVERDEEYGVQLLEMAHTDNGLTDAGEILADIFAKGRYGIAVNRARSASYRQTPSH